VSADTRTGLPAGSPPPCATLLLDTQCTLGEGATWCAKTSRFYWTDIEGARLWRYDPSDDSSTSWPMPERLATFALCADPYYLLLGLATHLAFFNLATGETQPIADVEPGMNTRVNDGRCDRQGRFVFGTKDEGSPLQAIGGFYRLNHDLSLERLPLPAPAISNSIAFSPDGATMYYCDSPTREIRTCDYHADGSIANDRLFTKLTDASGEPDGSTVDGEGGLWNASTCRQRSRVVSHLAARQRVFFRSAWHWIRCTSRARASISTRLRSRTILQRVAYSSPDPGGEGCRNRCSKARRYSAE
jgi:L-arabinonolactonase